MFVCVFQAVMKSHSALSPTSEMLTQRSSTVVLSTLTVMNVAAMKTLGDKAVASCWKLLPTTPTARQVTVKEANFL